MKPTVIVILLAVAANSAGAPVYSACIRTAESSHTVVRGRFVRCEDASFYMAAAGAYQRYVEDLDEAIARVGPENRQALFERLGVSAEFPYDGSLEGRIAVVAIEWRAAIVPWVSETSATVEFKEELREMRETVRYWWRGSTEACESIAEWSPIDLWVYPECCDTARFGAQVCMVSMDYAELAPDAISSSIDQIVDVP